VGNFDQTLREGRGGKLETGKKGRRWVHVFRKLANLIKVPGEKINTYWNVEPSE
jgi:hypothetical protein